MRLALFCYGVPPVAGDLGRQAGRVLPLPLDIARGISEHGCQFREYLKRLSRMGLMRQTPKHEAVAMT